MKTTMFPLDSPWALWPVLEVSNETSKYFTFSPRSPSDKKFYRSAATKSGSEAHHNRNFGSYPGEKTKQHGTVQSTKVEANACLQLSNIPENYRPQSFDSTADTKLHDSFRKRLSAYKTSPAKTANEPENSSVDSTSGSRGHRRHRRSGSGNSQTANLADSLMSRATSVRSSVTQRSSGTQALLAHLFRPTSSLSPSRRYS